MRSALGPGDAGLAPLPLAAPVPITEYPAGFGFAPTPSRRNSKPIFVGLGVIGLAVVIIVGAMIVSRAGGAPKAGGASTTTDGPSHAYTGTFSPTGSMTTARGMHTATLTQAVEQLTRQMVDELGTKLNDAAPDYLSDSARVVLSRGSHSQLRDALLASVGNLRLYVSLGNGVVPEAWDRTKSELPPGSEPLAMSSAGVQRTVATSEAAPIDAM